MQNLKQKTGVLSRTGVALLTTGAFAIAGLAAVPAANAATPFETNVVINEVESNGSANDFIELYNKSASPITFVNAAVSDSEDSHVLTISDTIAGHGYYVVETDKSTTPGNFGLGNADSARLYAEGKTPSTAAALDEYSWTAHASTTYGRCGDGTVGFVTLTAASKGATNTCPVLGGNPDTTPWQGVVINEVESNGDTFDWVELYNTTASSINVSGAIIADDNNGHQVTVPSGTTLASHGYVTVNLDDPLVTGNYGLGANDEVRLFAPGTVDLVAADADGDTLDREKWSTHSPTTYGLDRSSASQKGIFRTTSGGSKGSANSFPAPPPVFTSADVVINEVESDPGSASGGDWIELANMTGTALNIEGLELADSDPFHTIKINAGTSIPANGYLAIQVDDALLVNGAFGLGSADSARLFNAGANTQTDTPIDSTSWTAHAANTWGRYPTNKTGSFQNTAGPTPNAAN